MNNPRDRWIAMPPEDRQIFRRNAERWMQMGPEERKVLRERERTYRERVKTEVDTTLRDSGLRLEGEKRDQFEQRYLQERRRIEHALRQETEAKRQEQLPALRERLKKEFQEPSPSGPSTSAPVPSTPPKK
jgi:TRAP-type C4-dicarboxylate transport system substrate-binding protein